MERKRKTPEGWEGRLPATAPLANPYVPFQMENPPKYEAKQGLSQGTLFPGLNLPFRGSVNKKEVAEGPMWDLQALGFAVQELALYLDTHRDDREVLALYREYQQMYAKCKEEYARRYGPMTNGMVSERTSYDWLDDPWPWEYCKNKEV